LTDKLNACRIQRMLIRSREQMLAVAAEWRARLAEYGDDK
jgi:hypothetical protein